MAKWGEGDPRWIVEERSDGKNVNNWHWTEKNATEYSKTMLKQLLIGVEFSDPEAGTVSTTELTTITGEASASNRKGKLIFFYEFDLKVKWSGKTADDTTVNGSIAIPNLSEENSISEVDVNTTMSSESTPGRAKLLAFVRKVAPKLIREKLAIWLRDFKEEYSKDIVLPTNVKVPQSERAPVLLQGPGSVPGSTSPATGAAASTATSPSTALGASASKKSGPVTTIELTDEFHCAPQDLFEALIREDRVSIFTQSAAKIDARVGGAFTLFSGNVSGVIQELTPYERIAQTWRFNTWTDGHFSDVVITISPKGSETSLRLVQTNVPVHDAERTRSGWHDLYFQRMKMILGFGSGISLGF